MKTIKILAMLLLLMLAAPAAADETPKNTDALDPFTTNFVVEAEAEFKASHAAAVEMRRLRVEAVELRRLASALAARRLAPRR